MTANERLTELIDRAKQEYANDVTDHTETEYIAECLFNSGVILPPATLDEKIIEAARLKYNNGRSTEEIAEIMGYSSRQISRFLKKFEEKTEEEIQKALQVAVK